MITWDDVQRLRVGDTLHQEVRLKGRIFFLPLRVSSVDERSVSLQYPDGEVIPLLPHNFPHERLFLSE